MGGVYPRLPWARQKGVVCIPKCIGAGRGGAGGGGVEGNVKRAVRILLECLLVMGIHVQCL